VSFASPRHFNLPDILPTEERLFTLLDQTQIDQQLRSRIRDQITRDFHAERGLDERAAEK